MKKAAKRSTLEQGLMEIAEVPKAQEASWHDWEQACRWSQTTIPGILYEDSTVPLPLELLDFDKH